MSERGGPVLKLVNLQRSFTQGGGAIRVLRGASANIGIGEVVALTGPSGAGKSTLLQLAGLLEQPDGGEVILEGKTCSALHDNQRTRMRREKLGFVYQFHHLLPEFSARENVMLPHMLRGSRSKARQYADELLERLGVGSRKEHRPPQMSGGEQQRVAIARALVNKPILLLADEPTGNLDQENAESVFEALLEIVRDTQLSALIATHNLNLASRMDRHVALDNGILSEQR